MCDKTMVKVQYAVRSVGNAGFMSVIVIWIHIKILKGNQKAKIEEYTMQYPTENDKKRSTQHYTENQWYNNTNPTQNWGRTQLLRKGKQFLLY
jgi:hypothetical protein